MLAGGGCEDTVGGAGGGTLGGAAGPVAGAVPTAGGTLDGVAGPDFVEDGAGGIGPLLAGDPGAVSFCSAGESLTVSGTPATGLGVAVAADVVASGCGRATTLPRLSAARPTATHAMSATPIQALPGRLAKRCCASQRNSFAPARQPAAPIEQQGQQTEARASESRAGDGRLDRIDGVAAGEKRRHVLGPLGQAGERHGDAANDQHWQEQALAERLHGGDIVGEHRDHEAQSEKRERHQRERDPQLSGWRGSGMPSAIARTICSAPAVMRIT